MSESIKKYDVIVLGAGPAGYVAAIRCAQLGLKTACIDNWCNQKGKASLGGAYINAGCIPALVLLESSKLYHLLNHDIKNHGISVDNIKIDVPKMISRKNLTVEHLSQNIKELLNKHEVEIIHAYGHLLDSNRVEITKVSNQSQSIIHGENIILATGSLPIEVSYATIDNEHIIDSNSALNIQSIPKRLGIIGAGIIGFELGGIWSRLGSEVILLEAQENFLTTPDHQISAEAHRIYTEQGLDIRLGARVMSAKKSKNKVILEYQDQDGTHSLNLDKLIVATGRKPNTENLAAAEAGLTLDESGYVHVDENCMTTLHGVYAIGDLTLLGPMLAHKGLEEGVFVAEHIANCHSPINYDIIPSVIYTDPEIAWVGQTEQALKAIGENIKVAVFPLSATGRAQATGRTEGMIKIIAHADTDKILGVHILGVNASELIAEAVIAMEFSASTEDMARTIHAHPTLSEAMQEAALSLSNRALHMPPEK
jgi:dihydrolipoamide dehydrogenase